VAATGRGAGHEEARMNAMPAGPERETAALLWGRHAVAAALAAGHPVNRIYLARDAKGAEIEQIKRLASERRVRFDFVAVGRLGRLSGTRAHQDVVAQLSPVAYLGVEELLARAATAPAATVVALDRLQHPGNVGMAVRTAAAAGVAGLLLPARGGRLVTGQVARAAAGAVFRVPMATSANLARDLARFRQAGFWLYGLDSRGTACVFDVDWPPRRVLVAGHEAEGLRPLVRRTVDELVRIPLAAGVESLNVCVALGVALFEIVRHEASGQAGTAEAQR